MIKRVKRLYNNFKKAFKRGETRILPGQLAFSFLMSLVPLLLIFTFIVSKISKAYDLSNIVYTIFPNFIADILIPILEGNGVSNNYLWLFVIGFYLSSSGLASIINTADMLYGIKDQQMFKVKIKSLLMTIFLIIILMFLIFIPVFGDVIVKFVIKLIKSDATSLLIMSIYQIFKLPVSLIFIYLNIKIIYTLAPDIDIKSKETTYGAIFTTFGWIIATKIYSIYITKLADYSIVYGSFASILVLFVWIYVLSYIFVIGMTMNIDYYQNKEKEKEN